MTKEFDFLVIGSGLAGLSYALRVADHGKVCVVSKSRIDETNTAMAQGGIAGVLYEESDIENHIKDTLDCGAGLCNKETVKIVVTEAKTQLEQLIAWGAEFDKTPDGAFDLAREGGHSANRILHHKDSSGWEIERALISQARNHPNIEIQENYFALEIITQHHLGEYINRQHNDIECYGAFIFNEQTGETHKYLSKITYMATGGACNIYQTTTNPPIATGDGVAMVYRAKGTVADMEFVQFHPTSLYNPGEKPSFLISEAVRGFGAILRDADGKSFMEKYDERGSLAPRDITARAIDKEMKNQGVDHVYLDCTHLNFDAFVKHFPNISQKCKSLGIDITKQYIPVVPAAHFLCGGIKVDKFGRSSIHNLYAGGEAACTGLHGANRLASNSLLEAVVFSARSANDSIKRIGRIELKQNVPDWNDEGTTFPEEMVLITQNWKEMQQIMSYYVGIVRSDLRLKRALYRLDIIYRETEELYKKTTVSRPLCELRNAINVAYLIIKWAEERRKNVGLHYNIDQG
jgi:L-aspartate oxidase